MSRRAALVLSAFILAVCGANAFASPSPLDERGALPAVPAVPLTATIKLHARKASSPSLALVSKPATNAPNFDFQSRIAEAQALVAKQPVLKGDMQFNTAGNLTHFVWVLAVGQRTGPLTVLRMDETGKNDRGFAVTWTVDNFINTRFHVKKPEGYIVFAQRRPVHGKSGYQEAVYTAYAPELDTKSMRDAGMNYLHGLQTQAYDQIQQQNLRSRVAPKLTVAEQIPQSMVIRLMITEHIDPLHMKYVGMQQCVHEVLVTLAANKTHSYAYAKSSAGALGLPQFIDSTYQMVRNNYPTAGLHPDFQTGMSDHPNAILASVLLLDLELTPLPRSYLKRFTDSSEQLSAFLAAGYNRNPSHVLQTYLKTHSITGGNAPFENKMYVKIQNWVGAFLAKEYGLS